MATSNRFLRGLYAMGTRGAIQDRSNVSYLSQSNKAPIALLDDTGQQINKPLKRRRHV